MLGYESIKKIVVRYGFKDNNNTKDIDISYILDSDIDMDFPLLTLYEILKQMRENNKLDLPEEIIITVNIKIKEKPIFYRGEKIIECVMIKNLLNQFNTKDSIIMADLSNFLYNLRYLLQEYEAHENIKADGITYIKECE